MMKQQMRIKRYIYIIGSMLVVLVMTGIHFSADTCKDNTRLQTPPVERIRRILPADTVRSQLDFLVDSLCTILDPAHSLDRFFSELMYLEEGKDTVLTIVHVGDSHIQAGSFPGRMMRLMQEQYGNAGRGWIAPFKLSRSNEPDDYFISSSVKEWTAGRCIQRIQKCPVGPGGIGIQTVSPFVDFDIVIAPNNGAGYTFNQVVLYRGDDSMPMLPAGTLKDSVRIFPGSIGETGEVLMDTFRISCLTDSLQLQSTRRKPGTDELFPAQAFTNLYYGFSLTNGEPGILYHSVGVNGAMFVNYTDEAYIRRLALLRPSLLIISLGTNETFGKRFQKAEFTGQVKDFLNLVEKYLPDTPILLTTPPECYKRYWENKKRKYTRNALTEQAADAIVQVAQEKGLACWDLFAATGGRSSAEKWYAGKWMSTDRIHFTKEGYSEQGVLLFRSLMKRKKELEKEQAGSF